MKFIIVVSISIVISIFILGVFIIFGIVKVKTPRDKSGNILTLPIPEKTSNFINRQPEDGANPQSAIVDTQKIPIDENVLRFLEDLKIKDTNDIEEQLSRFLIQEQHSDKKTADLMIRKCLLKNFQILQIPFEHFSNVKSFENQYLMEKKLKTAGFAAMGLTLMETELSSADSRFEHLKTKIIHAVEEK